MTQKVGRVKEIWSAFNPTLLGACSLIAVSQFNFGFDQTAFSTTQAMDAFDRRFGKYDPKKDEWAIEPYFLSLLNSLPYIGFALGLIIGSMISARYGRRMCMFVMSCYALCTAAICVSSKNQAQILTGRILNYGYVGMELAVVPIFQSEIVPREVRGFTVGTYQLMLNFGGLIMSLICQGTKYIEGDNSWRIPFGLFFIIPAIVAVSVWFIPESPRWLLMHHRPEEAYETLKKLRVGRYTEEQITAEFNELKTIILDDLVEKDFRELFRGTNHRRTWITVGTNFFLQITGQVFTAKYGTVYMKSLGTVDAFTMTAVNKTINTFAVFVAMYGTDKFGRRPLLFYGGIIQTIALFTMGGLGTPKVVTDQMKAGIVSMLLIFDIGFYTGWAPVSHIVSAEIPTSRLRDMTYRLASAVNIFIQFVTTFIIPYLLDAPYANLKAKVGFVFGSTAICAILFGYFCIPECKGRSLEEVDRLFLENVPIRKFKTYQVVVEHESNKMDDMDPDVKTAVVKEDMLDRA